MKEPKLRFKADDGSDFPDWEDVCFGSLYEKNMERNTELEFDSSKTISIASMSFKEQGNGASEDSLTTYKVLRIGDIAFEGHENKEYKYGRFVLNDIGDGIMSPRFSCLRPVSKQVRGFWKYYIHLEQVMKRILVRATKKGTMMHELVIPDFLKQSIMVPSLPEQQKIADFLSTIDTIIEKQRATVLAWEERKKGVMQKLFSQEVRFKADDGSAFPDWEEKKIEELIQLYDEKVASGCELPVLTSSKKNGIEYQEEHFAGKQRHDIDGYNVLPRNYCTYRNRSDGTDFTFNINRLCDKGIVSKFYPVFKENNCDLFFLVSLLNNEPQAVRKIAYTAKGTGQKVLSIIDLKSIMIMMPSLPEQQKIADCLSALDTVIEKQKETLEKWQELKKGLLQQMFV